MPFRPAALLLLFAAACLGGREQPAGPPTLLAITLSPASAQLPVGSGKVFTASGNYDDGVARDLTALVHWAVSDATLASVTASGGVTARAKGSATVTAALLGVQGSAALTLLPARLSSIAVSPGAAVVPLGLTQQFTAAGTFGDGSVAAVPVAWNSSNPAVANVDATGVVRPLSVGTTTITARAGLISGSASLGVVAKKALTLLLTPATVEIPAGLTRAFTASATYTDGTSGNATADAQWDTSDRTVATAATGIVAGLAAGHVAVTAALQGLSASADATVLAPVPVSILVTPPLDKLAQGMTLQLAAAAIGSDGRSVSVTAKAAWVSSNPLVATVSATGLVTSVANGRVQIAASYGGLRGEAVLASGNCHPGGLPSHLGLGLNSQPKQLPWMTASGIPWDFRYQYMGGGVNTGWGWQTWANPIGQFAVDYLQTSGDNCYIPVFSYYELINSNPDPNLEHVNVKLGNAGTMHDYFALYELLLQKVAGYDGVAIIQVEPDVWGFIQVANGNDPTQTTVMVNGSGFADVAGYEDTARGFAQALVHLRDLLAPKALLAWHASSWATGLDVALQVEDPVALGTATAAFYLGLKAPFDLIFYDPSDHDAAWYQLVAGAARWWDDASFTRYRQFIATMTAQTGRKAMLWQVPIGNRLSRACNNTNDHYQDNHVEYFFGPDAGQHLAEYAGAGVIGILFGRGNDGSTSYDDSAADGVTNPAPINGNTLSGTATDDDGGFLRLSAAAYYAAGGLLIP